MKSREQKRREAIARIQKNIDGQLSIPAIQRHPGFLEHLEQELRNAEGKNK